MNYIIRTQENILTSFYYNNDKIYSKTYEKNNFCNETMIIGNVFDNFTVCMDYDSSIYIFCQNKNGDILLCTKNKKEISIKTILENKSNTIYRVQFTALITEKGLSLIYNTPTHLVMQQLDKNGKWNPAVNIDEYVSLPNSNYIVQNTSYKHLVLFYLNSKNYLAFREVNTEKYGEINIFHSTAQQIIDTSFLINNNSIHMIFIVKNLLSCQLLYRKKDSDEFSNIKILCEAPKIENCLIFEIENTIHISFGINGQLYILKLEDNENSFSKAIRYRENFSLNLRKSVLISENIDEHANMSEIYVSKSDPCKILLIPDIYENFYRRKEILKQTPPSKIDKPKPQTPEINNDGFNKLQSQYNLLMTQLAEKDEKILYYDNLLKKKNEELYTLENDWNRKYREILNENEMLKNKIEKSKLLYEQVALIESENNE